jgi:hypothetical protein
MADYLPGQQFHDLVDSGDVIVQPGAEVVVGQIRDCRPGVFQPLLVVGNQYAIPRLANIELHVFRPRAE